MLYLGYIMLRFAVLIYSLEVAFNISLLTFLHENVIKSSLFSKNCFFLLPAIFSELPITRRFEGWIFLCPVSHNV